MNPIKDSKIQDYQLGRELGKGAYAVVKQGLHKKSNTQVAMKVYDKYKLTDNARKQSVKREISLLNRLTHPNIVRLFDSFDTRNTVSVGNLLAD